MARDVGASNIETVRRWIDAYNRRDIDAVVGLTDPRFEFRSIFVSIETVFRGYEGLYAYFKTLDDAYERFQVVPRDVIDAGAAVLMPANVEWRGKESGATGETPVFIAFWLRARRVLMIETFTDRAEAFDAVGLADGPPSTRPRTI
jgi:ketosteroid isomerase-like protein